MGWTPYHYVHQKPINLIDPTGISAEGPDDPPRKNIVINFLRNEVGEKGGPLGNFNNKDMKVNDWHVMDVTSIE